MIEELRRSANVDRLAPHISEVNVSCPEVVSVLFPEFSKVDRKRKRSADVDQTKKVCDDPPSQKRRISPPLPGWYGCSVCGNVWPRRVIHTYGAAECHCTDPLDDTLATCWVGPEDHDHRKFLFQSSSPFWTNRPDHSDPKYCVPK